MLTNASAVVAVESVLVEIDGPQLVISRDAVGARYLCIATRTDKDGDHYLGVQISDERLRQLRDGALEVRAVFDQPEMGMLYEGVLRRTKRQAAIHFVAQSDIPTRSLPGKDLFLTDFEDPPEDETAVG